MARYKYDSINRVEIPIAGGPEPTNFTGTRSEWNSLTAVEKSQYKTKDIIEEVNNLPIDQVPTSGSNNPVASGGVYTAIQTATSEIEDPKVYISGVEESSTASQAYTTGEYLIYDGALYKVIASVVLGDTLTEGTNISATTVAGEIANHLSVNGTEFFFDSHDGQFGYNTSSSRGADTFVPFSNSSSVYLGNSTGSIDVSTRVSNYSELTASDFYITVNQVYWTNNNITKTANPLIAKSYNSSTGVLTFSITGGRIDSADVYLKKGSAVSILHPVYKTGASGGNYTTSLTASGLTIGKTYFIATSQYSSGSVTSISGLSNTTSYQSNISNASSGVPGLITGIATATSVTIGFSSHNGGTAIAVFENYPDSIILNPVYKNGTSGGNNTTSLTISGLTVGKTYIIVDSQYSSGANNITGVSGLEGVVHHQTITNNAVSGTPGIITGIATATSVTVNFASHNGGTAMIVFEN